MRATRLPLGLVVVLTGTLAGCSTTGANSADVSDRIRKLLDQAGLTDVSAGHDRDRGAVTLSGHVAANADKSRAESIAESIAAGEAVSNQIAVGPAGGAKDIKVVNSNLDKGIGRNLDDALAISSEIDPMSTCQRYTDIYLQNDSSRIMSVDIKRSNNVDGETSVLTYTINPSQTTPQWLPWVGGRRTYKLKIGCQFEGAKTYVYTITRAEYR
jgi:hypothetical protein